MFHSNVSPLYNCEYTFFFYFHHFEKIRVQMVRHVVGWICEFVVFHSVNGKEFSFIFKIVTWWNSQKKISMPIYFSILKTVRNTSSSGFISEVITNSRFFVWILSVKFKILNNHLDSVQLSIWKITIHLLLTSRLTSKGGSQDPNSSMVFFGQLLKRTLEKRTHLWKFNICIGFWTILSKRMFFVNPRPLDEQKFRPGSYGS